MIKVKRIYDPPASGDGTRALVDRLWPRGVAKANARIDLWLKEVAPSDGLRAWFGHAPERWAEFRQRYWAELEGSPSPVRVLLEAARAGDLTLLYSARDTERNNAVALREYLERKAG